MRKSVYQATEGAKAVFIKEILNKDLGEKFQNLFKAECNKKKIKILHDLDLKNDSIRLVKGTIIKGRMLNTDIYNRAYRVHTCSVSSLKRNIKNFIRSIIKEIPTNTYVSIRQYMTIHQDQETGNCFLIVRLTHICPSLDFEPQKKFPN